MKTILLLPVLLLLFFSNNVNAQSEIHFTKQQHDFGKVANLDYPPASFEFSNTGNAPLAILMVHKNPNIRVGYENKFFQPGEKGRILILPDLNSIGLFTEQIEIITNSNNSPVILTITGEVISIQECFPNKTNMEIRKVVIIDEVTKEPVPNAQLAFTFNYNFSFNDKADKKGELVRELKIGKYALGIQSPGYEPKDTTFFLRRSVPVLFFELTPLIAPVEEYLAESIIEQKDILPPSGSDELLPINKYAANNIVLLVDVSLSMKQDQKLELLKVAVTNLVLVLRSIDNVALISYADKPTILLRSVNGTEKQKINEAIKNLIPNGVTNGVKGLESAYQLAEKKFEPSGNNQIILATDGKFSGGGLTDEDFQNILIQYARQGIKLSVIGFGDDEKAIGKMEEMAKSGQGKYIHISNSEDISNVLIEEIKENSLIK
ncbi:MAG: VWA domain-containing protein [Bacteroidales bacterium]|nr:VWA domain-containing protein [Bacteroidales bacterium]